MSQNNTDLVLTANGVITREELEKQLQAEQKLKYHEGERNHMHRNKFSRAGRGRLK